MNYIFFIPIKCLSFYHIVYRAFYFDKNHHFIILLSFYFDKNIIHMCIYISYLYNIWTKILREYIPEHMLLH